jgi:predicted amidohydrolase YtcJ
MGNQSVLSSTAAHNSVAYINGRVYTVNASQPWAEAFIVSPDGKFTTVGSNKEVREIAAAQKLVTYDLANQFVMPGIHDAHLHLLIAGFSKLGGINMGANSIIPPTEAAKSVKDAACMCSHAHVFGDWLYGDLFLFDQFDRSHLDEEYPDTPVVVRGGGGHTLFLNTAALKASGYDIESEPDSKAALLVRRPDGSLTGEVAELGMTKALLAYTKPNLAHVKRALKLAFSLLHRSGITSCQDASSNTLLLHALRELESEQALKCNVFTHIVYAPEMLGEEPEADLHSLIDRAHEFKSKHVDTRFIKMMLDGVPLPPHFTHAGLTETGEVDESKIFLDDVIESVKKCDARGLTVKIHCSGRGSARRALDAFEAARKANPNGPKHEVAHCSGVHDGKLLSSLCLVVSILQKGPVVPPPSRSIRLVRSPFSTRSQLPI